MEADSSLVRAQTNDGNLIRVTDLIIQEYHDLQNKEIDDYGGELLDAEFVSQIFKVRPRSQSHKIYTL